jgi:alpha-amylase
MTVNQTIIQFFHWDYPNDGSLWKHCAAEASFLQKLGFTHVWLPPAYKSAWGTNEPGYAVYDHFDLGEFDQQRTVPTKYGTKQEYIDCIKTLHEHKLQVLADIVLNHKVGGEETEKFNVKQVNPDNRTEISPEEQEIEAFTKFSFPGRNKKYSGFVWDFHSFSGVSKEENGENKIFTILNEYGEDWEEMMDDENGNFDYLMGNDSEARIEYVRAEMKKWG